MPPFRVWSFVPAPTGCNCPGESDIDAAEIIRVDAFVLFSDIFGKNAIVKQLQVALTPTY
jgi:hypothetical protein